ncbi:uncharacterized protein LOC104898869 [Beta vulgaris subsp. vulgaris]|uniref:uncharacterized protein LOC104898869 n=1 Tax=Beta vulgaris subsp. vulgaris TaxID=3555 RepID=UPI00053FD215|nr:uncharacterized protein LOC104898869 [Beta vulgaris subsp. vulgaris]
MRDSSFSISKYYQQIRSNGEKLQWCRSVWNRYSQPKHRFIQWLAMQDRLKTKARLKMMQISIDDTCVVCGSMTESVEHLMFDCHFSKHCMNKLMNWLKVPWRGRNMNLLCSWVTTRYKSTRVQRQVILATIAAAIHSIWKNRNQAYWDHTVNMIDQVVQQVKYSVKHRCLQVLGNKVNDRDRQWVENL